MSLDGSSFTPVRVWPGSQSGQAPQLNDSWGKWLSSVTNYSAIQAQEEKKAEEKRAEEKKFEERKNEDKKAAEKKQAERNLENKKDSQRLSRSYRPLDTQYEQALRAKVRILDKTEETSLSKRSAILRSPWAKLYYRDLLEQSKKEEDSSKSDEEGNSSEPKYNQALPHKEKTASAKQPPASFQNPLDKYYASVELKQVKEEESDKDRQLEKQNSLASNANGQAPQANASQTSAPQTKKPADYGANQAKKESARQNNQQTKTAKDESSKAGLLAKAHPEEKETETNKLTRLEPSTAKQGKGAQAEKDPTQEGNTLDKPPEEDQGEIANVAELSNELSSPASQLNLIGIKPEDDEAQQEDDEFYFLDESIKSNLVRQSIQPSSKSNKKAVNDAVGEKQQGKQHEGQERQEDEQEEQGAYTKDSDFLVEHEHPSLSEEGTIDTQAYSSFSQAQPNFSSPEGGAISALTFAKSLPTEGPLIHLINSIRKFCGNRIINDLGDWESEIYINPELLSGTELAIYISVSKLLLRFTVTDLHTETLIYQYSQALKSDLQKMLKALGCPRDVEILLNDIPL